MTSPPTTRTLPPAPLIRRRRGTSLRQLQPADSGWPADRPSRTLEEAQRRYNSAGPGTTLLDARERLEMLTSRDLTARSAACQPLTPDECLEVLALVELLARYQRHPDGVHQAVASGSSWTQIAEAVGGSAEQARFSAVSGEVGDKPRYEGRPPKVQWCTSIAAYSSAVRKARAVPGFGARTSAAVPSQAVPLSDSNGP